LIQIARLSLCAIFAHRFNASTKACAPCLRICPSVRLPSEAMMAINKEHIIDVLKQCFDPEIPVDLWNLGLIYDIKIDEPNVVITMSLTTPGCGMAQMMAEDIKTKVTSLNSIEETTVEVTFDPPWNPEMMSDEAKEKLGFSPSKTQSENISTEWD